MLEYHSKTLYDRTSFISLDTITLNLEVMLFNILYNGHITIIM
jgi:hypothetical protein